MMNDFFDVVLMYLYTAYELRTGRRRDCSLGNSIFQPSHSRSRPIVWSFYLPRLTAGCFDSNIFLRQKHARRLRITNTQFEYRNKFLSADLRIQFIVEQMEIHVFLSIRVSFFLSVFVPIMIKCLNRVFPFPSNPTQFSFVCFIFFYVFSFGTIMLTTYFSAFFDKWRSPPFNGNNVKHSSVHASLIGSYSLSLHR